MNSDDLVHDTYKVIESSRRQKSQTYLLNQENYSYVLKNNKKFQSTYKTIWLYIREIGVLDSVYPHLNQALRQRIYFVSNQMVRHLQHLHQPAFILKNIVYCVACFLLAQHGLVPKKQAFLSHSRIKYRYFIKHKNQIAHFALSPPPLAAPPGYQSLLKAFCRVVQEDMSRRQFFSQDIGDRLFLRLEHALATLLRTNTIAVFLENHSDLKYLSVFYLLLLHKFHFKDLNQEVLKQLALLDPSHSFSALKNQMQYLKHLLLCDLQNLLPSLPDLAASTAALPKNHQQRLHLEYYLKHLKTLLPAQ